jgi:hypothetical protein
VSTADVDAWMRGCVDAGPYLDEASQVEFDIQAVQYLSRSSERSSSVEVVSSEGCVGTRWRDIKRELSTAATVPLPRASTGLGEPSDRLLRGGRSSP